MPATLRTASSCPNASTAICTAASTSASTVTSQWMGTTASPISAAVSRSAPLKSAATTLAPSRTNTFADAFAMPEPAPVITATLPSNSPIDAPPGGQNRARRMLRICSRRKRRHAVEGVHVATISAHEVRYDPYDVEINADPYPVFRRLRDEAPLYYNERYRFWALSRYADVERAFVDWQTFSSSHGDVLEVVQSGMEIPSGMVVWEDPPVHTQHR